MFRIRFHGRGGQGMKTASRILGTAFFKSGYEVQDAPRYGAERRGAPISAYVRADKSAINERGIISHPDLVVVADDTLVGMPAAGVTQGIDAHTVLLINSHENASTWRQRLNTEANILTLVALEDVEDRATLPFIGSRCAAAAAALTGAISRDLLIEALCQELGHLNEDIITQNRDIALSEFDDMSTHAGLVEQSGLPSASDYVKPDWIDLPFENAADFQPRDSCRRHQCQGAYRSCGVPCDQSSIMKTVVAVPGSAVPTAPMVRSTCAPMVIPTSITIIARVA